MRVLGAILLALLLSATARSARAVDVSQLSDFEANPCVMALAERNTAEHVDAPDSALADACERAHDSAEVAWDFLTRTWQPREVAAPGLLATAAPLPATAVLLAILEFVLVYLVLGRPVAAIAAMLRPAAGLPPRPRRLAAEAAGCVVGRLVLGSVLLALLALPLLTAAAAVIVTVAAIRAQRPRRLPAEPPATQASAAAEIFAAVVNDAASVAAGLLALALAARGHWRLLALGVVLCILASLPPLMRARRAVRVIPLVFAGSGVLLALAAGALALSDPLLARASMLAGGALTMILPLAFAGIAAWRMRLFDRLRPGRRQFSGG